MARITDTLGKEIISKYLNGIKVKVLSTEYGISQQTINRYLKSHNVEKVQYVHPNKFSDEKEQKIIELYKQGKNTKEIAQMFNTFNTSIRRVLIRNGIKLRTNENVLRLCKHNPFKKNDEFSEYFLGLLLTDGCITKEKNSSRNYGINLSLSEVDSYIVEAFRDWASPNSKVTKIYQKINGSYMYGVTITNREAEEWLRRKGNFTNKSYHCKIYTPITWHILRGIFYVDVGFVGNTNSIDFFVCGASKPFIEQIYIFLNKNNIRASMYESNNSKNKLYYVGVYRNEDVEKLCQLMYNNAHIYIKRKYDKWLAFYESRRANGVNSGNERAFQP